eukprot:2727735-Prymnesium_polylepis.1
MHDLPRPPARTLMNALRLDPNGFAAAQEGSAACSARVAAAVFDAADRSALESCAPASLKQKSSAPDQLGEWREAADAVYVLSS